MVEIAQHFEQVAARFNPMVLIGLGVAALVVGLFVWLGGLGLRKILLAVAGVVAGGVCGFLLTGGNIIFAVVAGALAVLIAVVFEKIFIVILTGVIAAAFGFAVLAGPYLEHSDSSKQYRAFETQGAAEPLSIGETVETFKVYAADFSDAIRQTCLQVPLYSWAVIAALIVIVVTAGLFLWRLTSALCCAALGTVLIFVGMILLLLYKGAEPISVICQRGHFYLCALIAMIVFGTIVQLLVCPRRTKSSTAGKQISKEKQEPRKVLPSWRTS